MKCTLETQQTIFASLLAKGYSKETASAFISALNKRDETSANTKLVEDSASRAVAVTEEDKAFLTGVVGKLNERIDKVLDGSTIRSFKELMLSLLPPDEATKATEILNRMLLSQGNFTSPNLALLDNLDYLIEIHTKLGNADVVFRLNKEKENELRKETTKEENEYNEIRYLEEIIRMVDIVAQENQLPGSVNEAINNATTKISTLKKLIGMSEAMVAEAKKNLKALGRKAKPDDILAAKKEIETAQKNLNELKANLKEAEAERAEALKKGIKEGVVDKLGNPKSMTTVGSIRQKVQKRIDTLFENKAKESLKQLGDNARTIAKTLEEKMLKEKTSIDTIKKAKEQIIRLMDSYLAVKEENKEEDGTIDQVFMTNLVGNMVMQKVLADRFKEDPKKTKDMPLTKGEALRAVSEWEKMHRTAIRNGFYVGDITTATEDQVNMLNSIASGSFVIDPVGSDVNNMVIPIDRSHAEAAAMSNPGVIPEKNKAKTAKELAAWLDATIRSLMAIRAGVKNNGKITSKALDMALHPKLYDLVSAAFADKMKPTRVYRNFSKVNATAGVAVHKEILRNLGIADPDSLPDFQPGWAENNDKLISIDTEGPIVDGTVPRFMSIQITTYENGVKTTKVLLNRNNVLQDSLSGVSGNVSFLTQAQVDQVLSMIEDYQNRGYKVITHNGNRSDFKWMGEQASNANQALRIALRAIDTFANVTENMPTGVSRRGTGLKALAQKNTKPYERMAYNGTIKFTNGSVRFVDGDSETELEGKNIEAYWNEGQNGNWDKFLAYASHDTEITLDLYLAMVEEGSTIVTNQGHVHTGGRPTTTLMLPMTKTAQGNSIDKLVSELGALSKEFTREVDNTLFEDRLDLDLDAVIDQFQEWLIAAWAADPDNKQKLDMLIEGYEGEITSKNLLNILTRDKALEFGKGVSKLNKRLFERMGYPLRVNAIESRVDGEIVMQIADSAFDQDTDGSFVSVNEQNFYQFAEDIHGNRLKNEQGAEIYANEVVISFLDYVKDKKNFIEDMAKKFNLPQKDPGEPDAKYLSRVLPIVVKKYLKQDNLAAFGNGVLDWQAAADVGVALANVLEGKKSGLTLVDSLIHDEGNIRNSQELSGTSAVYRGREKLFLMPDRDHVNFADPFGIQNEALAYDNFRLTSRVMHILGNNWSAADIDTMYDWVAKPKKADKRQALSAFTRNQFPAIFPNFIGRSAWDNVPDLWERQLISMEFAFDIPRLLSVYNHDCTYWGLGAGGRFLDGEHPVFYKEAFYTPGAPVAAFVLSGAIDQVAHLMQFDAMTPDAEAELSKALDRGFDIIARDPEAIKNSNRSDYSFNGLHLQEMMLIAYGAGGFDIFRSFLEALGKTETGPDGRLIFTEEHMRTNEDPRFKAIDALLENFDKDKNEIKMTYKLSDKQMQDLEVVLDFFKGSLSTPEGREEAKEFMKGAITPSFYDAGFAGVYNGLMSKASANGTDLSQPQIKLLAQLLTKHLLVSHGTYVDAQLKRASGKITNTATGMTQDKKDRLKQIIISGSKDKLTNEKMRGTKGAISRNFFDESERMARLASLHRYVENFVDNVAERLSNQHTSKSKREAEKGKIKAELTKTYKNRVEEANKILRDVQYEILTPEERAEVETRVNRIMTGGEAGYKRHLMLYALNRRAATPMQLMADKKKLHEAISGVHIDDSDFEALLDKAIYFAYGNELASGRNHMFGGYGQGPESSKLAQVRTDENVMGIWNIAETYTKEDEFRKAFVMQMMMELAPWYAPPSEINYDVNENEGLERFFEALYERSMMERVAVKNAFAIEQGMANRHVTDGFTVKEILAKRRKAAGLSFERLPYPRLANKTVSPNNMLVTDKTVDGLASFRPAFADIDFSQKAMYSLVAMQNQIAIDQTREAQNIQKTKTLRDAPTTDINSIIPQKFRGYAKTTDKKNLPHIPAQTGHTLTEMVTGRQRNIEFQSNLIKNKALWFARSMGLDKVMDPKDWTRLYLLHEMRRQAMYPAMEELDQNDANSVFRARVKLFDPIFKMLGITGRAYADEKVYSVIDLMTREQDIKFTSEEIRNLKSQFPDGLSYLSLLVYLSNQHPRLKGIKLGVAFTPGIVIQGKPSLITGSLPRDKALFTFNTEVTQLYYLILNSEVFRKNATEYYKNDPKVFDNLPKDTSGTLLLEGLPLDKRAQEIIMKKSLQDSRALASEFSRKQITFTFTQQDIDSGHIVMEKGVIQRQDRLTGSTHVFTGVHSPDTLWMFTEDMIVQMLNSLNNNPLFSRFELAFQTESDIGFMNTDVDQMVIEEQNNMLDSIGRSVHDQHKALLHLHTVDPGTTNPLTINNYRNLQEDGSPTKELNAPKYLTEAVSITVMGEQKWVDMETMMYLSDLIRASETAKKLGMVSEAKEIDTFIFRVLSDNTFYVPEFTQEPLHASAKFLPIRAASVLYHTMKKDGATKTSTMIDFLQPGLSPESANNLTKLSFGVARAMQRVFNLNPMENQEAYYVASAIIEKTDLVPDKLEQDENFVNIVISNMTNKTDVNSVRRAILRASKDKELDIVDDSIPWTTGTPTRDVAKFANPDVFVEHFGDSGRGIVDMLDGLVARGLISRRTADMKQILIGALAIHNPNILSDLAIEAKEMEGHTYASMAKVKGKYTIGLNIKAMQVTPETEMLLKFAEELVHLARVKYIADDSPEYQRIVGIFQTPKSEGMIREMLMAMNKGKTYDQIERDVKYAMSKPDEFLAHYGAMILLSETIYTQETINALEAKYEAVADVGTWWRRAFNKIKTTAKRALTMMAQLAGDPYYGKTYNEMYSVMQGVIGQGIEARKDVNNPDVEYQATRNVSTREHTLSPVEQTNVRRLVAERNAAQSVIDNPTSSATDVASARNHLAEVNTKLDDPRTNPLSVLGMREDQIVEGMNGISRHRRTNRILRLDNNPVGTRALLAQMMNNSFGQRGNLVVNHNTLGGALRRLFGNKQDKVVDVVQNVLLQHPGNRTGLTYQSPEALIIFLSELIDNTTVATESSYRPSLHGGGFESNKETLKTYVAEIMNAGAEIQRAFPQREIRERIHAQAARHVLGLPLAPMANENETNAMRKLASAMTVFNNQMNRLMVDSHLVEGSSGLDPIGLRLRNSQKLNKGEITKGYETVTSLIRKKMLDNLDKDGANSSVNPYILFLGGLMPRPTEDLQTNNMFIKFFNNPDAKAVSGEEAVMKELVQRSIDVAIRHERKTNPSADRTTVANKGIAYLSKFTNEAITNFIYETRENTTSFSGAFATLDNTETSLLMDGYRQTVEMENQDPSVSQRINEIIAPNSPFAFYQGYTEYVSGDSGKAAPVEIMTREFFGKLGVSAYKFNQGSSFPTYMDIFVDPIMEPDEGMDVVRMMFNEDMTDITHSLLKGIGYDAIQRILVTEMTGVDGAYFTFSQLIEMARQVVTNSTNYDKGMALLNFDGRDNPNRRALLEASLDRLELANMKAKETLGQRIEGSPLVDFVNKFSRVATHMTFGPNTALATGMVEGTMGGINMTLNGGNPIRFFAEAFIENTMQFLQGTTRLVGRSRDGNIQFWNVEPYAINDLARNSLWIMFETTSPQLPGQLVGDAFDNESLQEMSAFERFQAYSSRVFSGPMRALRVAHDNSANRATAEMIRNGSLYKLRDAVNSILRDNPSPSNAVLQQVIKVSGAKVTQERLLALVRSGVFEPGMIETLEYVMTSSPSSRGRINLSAFSRLEEESDPTMTGRGGIPITPRMLYNARGVIVKIMKSYTQHAMVVDHPLDGTAATGGMNLIMNFYKSYPALFVAQVLIRRGSTTPALQMAVELLAYGLLDMLYNILLAFASGYYRWEKVKEKIQKGEVNGKEAVRLLLRYPIFSMNLLGLGANTTRLALLGGMPDNTFSSVGEGALVQTAKNFWNGITAWPKVAMGMEKPGEASIQTYNMVRSLAPIPASTFVKMILEQSFGKTNTSGDPRKLPGKVTRNTNQNTTNGTREELVRQMFKDSYIDSVEKNKLRKAMEPKAREIQKTTMPKATVSSTPSLQQQATTPIKAPSGL